MEKRVDDGVAVGSPNGRATNNHAVLNDPEMDDLTTYEKKALIVNRELNSHGMGRYQESFKPSSSSPIIAKLTLPVVYILLVRVWLFDRSSVCSGICPCGASNATGVGLLRSVADDFREKTYIKESSRPCPRKSLFSFWSRLMCRGMFICNPECFWNTMSYSKYI